MSSHANRSGGTTAGAAAGTIITRVIARAGVAAAAIVATLAMLLCTLTIGVAQAHAADAPDANLGVDLGSGATGYTVESLHQNGAKEESLAAVVKWRQDALNDTSVKWDGKTMKQYLADNGISESEYLSPKWSNALERIAIQRAVESYGSDGHTRPNGQPWSVAQYNGYSADGEILAWGSSSFTNAMDMWASEKKAYVNESGGVTGHYTTLIDPDYKAYGFGAASAMTYGNVYAGEVTSSIGWDETPTNIQGAYTVEANLSSEKLAQGVTTDLPSVLTIGTSFKPVVKADAYNKRYTMRGTWGTPDAAIAAVQSDGSILGKAAGNIALTFTLTNGTEETFPVEVSSKSIKSITPPHVTVDSDLYKPTSQLPKTVEAIYTDGTTGAVSVDWDAIPDDWNETFKQHDVIIHGTVSGFADGVDLTMTVRSAVPKSAQAVIPGSWNTPEVQTYAGVVPDLSKLYPSVEWSNGWSRLDWQSALSWDQADLVASRFDTVGDKVTIHGTVKATSFDDSTKFWTLPVSLDVTVVAAEVKSVEPTQDTITTESGTAPDLSQVKAKVTYANGDTATTDVTWSEPAKADYSKREGGTFTVNGTANVGGTSHDVSVTVKVNPATITSASTGKDYALTSAGVDPSSQLKQFYNIAKVTWSNGDSEDLAITWKPIDKASYMKRGTTFDAEGTVSWNGTTYPVKQAVKVGDPAFAAIEQPKDAVTTVVGVAPDLSGVKAKVTFTDDSVEFRDVDWDPIDPSEYASVGSFEVSGFVSGSDNTVTVTVHVVAATPTKAEVPSGVAVTVDSGTKPDLSNVLATVTWSNGTTTKEKVAWDEPMWADYGSRAGGDFTINGTVSVGGQSFKVTATYRVNPATRKSATVSPDALETPAGVDPTSKLPQTANVTWSNGDTTDEKVMWDAITADQYATEGNRFTVYGTVGSGSDTKTVSVQITVTAPVTPSVTDVTAEPSTITTESGTAPNLGQVKAKVTYANGDTATTDVTWNEPAKADYSKREGGTFTVHGTADVAGTTYDLTVTVKVNPATITSATTDPASLTTPAGIDPTSRLPKTAKVTWSNGDSEDLDVRWYQFPEDDYLKEGNKFDITGYVAWNTVAHRVTLPVTVTAPKVKDVAADPAGVNTTVGVAPDLSQVKAKVTYTNGTTSTEDVSWDAVSADQYASHGMFTVDGTFTVNGETQTVRVLVTVNDATPTKAEVPSGVAMTVDSGTKPDLSNVLATVTWSNGTTTKEKVAWDEPMWADYGSRAGGDFTINGTVSVDGQSFKVTATYRVNPATVKSVLEEPINVEPTTVGVQPVLPKTTKVTWSNGDVTDVPIEWQPVDVSKAGLANAYGSVSVDGAVYRVSVQITINDNQCTTSFSDVTAATPHSKDITWLACKKISAGYANGDGTYSFGGMRLVVRQDMAAFLYRLAGSPAFDADAALRRNPFTDVNAGTPHYREILWLYEVGIAKGYADGTFGGDRLVVRQDMAAFLHRFADQQGANPTLKDGVTFTDLAGAGHAEDIQWLARTGVTTGWKMDDGSYEFRGMNAVVRQDMAAFLHRMDMYVLSK